MMSGSMMGWAWLWPVLVLVGLALLGYVAIRLARSRGTSGAEPAGGPQARSSARQILDERFARGEIEDEEYRRRRQELE